jgi:hypothetical protein
MPRQMGSNVIFTLTASNGPSAATGTNVTDTTSRLYALLVTLLQVQEHIQAEQAFGQ